MSMSPTIHNAISSLCPEAGLEIQGKQIYSNIKWLDNLSSHPTEAEVATELIRLQTEFDAQAYARNRAAEYPSQGDQNDMIYKDTKNSTTTHADAVEAVKTKWPKDNSGPIG